MFRIPEFNLDQISFWLGFVAASLFWLVFSRVKFIFPKISRAARNRIEVIKERQRAGIDLIYRQEVLRQAQNTHLTNSFFSLDEIIISPRIIPSQRFPGVDQDPYEITIAEQVIPFLPDWPEITARYPIHFVDPLTLIYNPVRIALIGEPGSGKTTTLAYLASKLSRKETASDDLNHLVPVFIHALDINLQQLNSATLPLEILISAVTNKMPAIIKQRIQKYLQSSAENNRLVLLLDGLDELSTPKLNQITSWIGSLLTTNPQFRIIISGASQLLDGLIPLVFQPMGLGGWSFDQRVLFSKIWGNLWIEKFGDGIEKSSNIPILSPDLISNWLWDENAYWSPLEWTLMIWGAYTGRSLGLSNKEGLEAYFSRLDQKIIPIEALQALAFDYCKNLEESRSFFQIEQFLKKYKPEQFQDIIDESAEHLPQPLKAKKKRKKVSSSEKAILHLLDMGVFQEHADEQIRFTNPLIAGYLASFAVSIANIDEVLDHGFWPIRTSLLQYVSGNQTIGNVIHQRYITPDTPLFKEFFVFTRAIKELPLDSPLRSAIMRQCIQLFSQESLPIGTRSRALSAIISANDPSISILLKQFLKSESPIVRQLSAIGCGAIQNKKALDDLILLLGDPDLIVQASTAIAIGAYRDAASLDILVESLMNSDEMVRQAVAETLSESGEAGIAILKDKIESNDLLVRRAVVSALVLIHDQWSIDKLEKMTIEDGQWVVRNAAGQALERIRNAKSFAPKNLPSPSDSAWLIEFAAKQGIGIPANEPATNLLMLALKSGTYDEKMNALNYLRFIPESNITDEIQALLVSESGPLQEAALAALWTISLSGSGI